MIQRILSKMHRNVKLALGFMLLIPVAAFAQEAADQLTDLNIKDQLDAVMLIVSQWKAGGALAGTVALVHFLVSLTKLKPLDPFFSSKPWIRPGLALGSGAILAFLSALLAGSALPAALLAGVMAGVGSMGLHELLNLFDKQKQAERAVASAMQKLAGSDGDILTKVNTLKSELDGIAALPDEKSRLDALAAWAKAHPTK